MDLSPFLQLLTFRTHFVEPASVEQHICTGPDDDKFIACALAGQARLIITGDKALLKVSGHQGIRIVRPAAFVAEYLG